MASPARGGQRKAAAPRNNPVPPSPVVRPYNTTHDGAPKVMVWVALAVCAAALLFAVVVISNRG